MKFKKPEYHGSDPELLRLAFASRLAQRKSDLLPIIIDNPSVPIVVPVSLELKRVEM